MYAAVKGVRITRSQNESNDSSLFTFRHLFSIIGLIFNNSNCRTS